MGRVAEVNLVLVGLGVAEMDLLRELARQHQCQCQIRQPRRQIRQPRRQIRQPWRQLNHCLRELGRDIAKSRGSATRAEKLENATAMVSEQRLAFHHSDYVSPDRRRINTGAKMVNKKCQEFGRATLRALQGPAGPSKVRSVGFKGLWKTVKQCVFQQPILKASCENMGNYSWRKNLWHFQNMA